jgi:hypothetical protein
MAISQAHFADVSELLTRDLRNTGMSSWLHLIERECRNALDVFNHPTRFNEVVDPRQVTEKVVEDVQQDILDSIVVWPVCPHHPNHPLWLHDGAWYCEQDNVMVAALGSLGAR